MKFGQQGMTQNFSSHEHEHNHNNKEFVFKSHISSFINTIKSEIYKFNSKLITKSTVNILKMINRNRLSWCMMEYHKRKAMNLC